MKSVQSIIFLGAFLLAPVASALAAAEERQDGSSLLMWAFLAMCVLIVILQLRPAVILTARLLKELFHAEIRAAEEDDDEEVLTVHRLPK